MRRNRKLFVGNRLRVTNGLQLRYSLASEDYVTLSGSAITQLLDLSGNNNHTDVQSTTTKRPTLVTNQLNGKPGAQLDGTDELNMPSSVYGIANGDNTCFAVANRDSEDANIDTIFSMREGSSTRLMLRFDATSGQVAYNSSTSTLSLTNSGNTNTKPQLITGSKLGSTRSLSVAGGVATTDNNGSNDGDVDSAKIGNSAGGYATGFFFEVLIFNRKLSDEEILTVEIYLANRWAIYHPQATWILSYDAATQASIHASKLNRDEV